MKHLKCSDVGFDCDHEIEAETEQEVLQKAAEHAKEVHNVVVTPDMAEQVKAQIRDDQ